MLMNDKSPFIDKFKQRKRQEKEGREPSPLVSFSKKSGDVRIWNDITYHASVGCIAAVLAFQ